MQNFQGKHVRALEVAVWGVLAAVAVAFVAWVVYQYGGPGEILLQQRIAASSNSLYFMDCADLEDSSQCDGYSHVSESFNLVISPQRQSEIVLQGNDIRTWEWLLDADGVHDDQKPELRDNFEIAVRCTRGETGSYDCPIPDFSGFEKVESIEQTQPGSADLRVRYSSPGTYLVRLEMSGHSLTEAPEEEEDDNMSFLARPAHAQDAEELIYAETRLAVVYNTSPSASLDIDPPLGPTDAAQCSTENALCAGGATIDEVVTLEDLSFDIDAGVPGIIDKGWSKTFGGSLKDIASAVAETPDGGYVAAGSTSSFGEGQADFWLVKVDIDGEEEWSRTFGGNQRDEASDVVPTADGGYAIAGQTRGTGAGQGDAWVIKTDSQGIEEWSQTYGGSKEDRASAIVQTNDGGYAFAGMTETCGDPTAPGGIAGPSGLVTIDFECYTGSPECPELPISGDSPFQIGGEDAFWSGFLDPSLRRDPLTGILWLTYAWPKAEVDFPGTGDSCALAGDPDLTCGGDVARGPITGIVDIHLASSDDNGSTWEYEGPLFEAQRQTYPGSTEDIFFSHEVSTIASRPTVGGETIWYEAHLAYAVEVEPEGRREIMGNSWTLQVSQASSLDEIPSADHVSLGGPWTDPAWNASLDLSSLSPEVAECDLWFEPSLLWAEDRLRLLASCLSFDEENDNEPLPENELMALFSTSASGGVDSWEWRFDGVAVGHEEAQELGGDSLLQGDMAYDSFGPDGNKLLLFVNPSHREEGQIHHSCEVLMLESLDNPVLSRDAGGSLEVVASLTAPEMEEYGSAACAYDPYSTSGVLFALRHWNQDEMTWTIRETEVLAPQSSRPSGSMGCSNDSDAWLARLDADGNLLWNQTFGEGHNDAALDLILEDDGSFVLTGRQEKTASIDDLLLAKADSEGNRVWSHTYGGDGDDMGYSLVAVPDGGYAVGGATESYAAGESDGWLLRTDSEGNELWDQVYGPAQGEADWVNSIAVSPAGGFVMAGATVAMGPGGPGDWGSGELWLFKTDSEGNMEWHDTYGGAQTEVGTHVIPASDGSYVIAGFTYSYGAGGGDMWLLKIFKEEWIRTHGGTGDDTGHAAVPATDGGYVVVGATDSYGAGEEDIWVVKLDEHGSMVWDRTFGGSLSDGSMSITRATDGGYVIAGSTESLEGGMGRQAWLIKIDESGNEVWSQDYGGNHDDWALNVIATADDGYAMTGGTYSSESGLWTEDTDGDMWVVKVDSQGNEEWNRHLGGDSYDVGTGIYQETDGGYVVVGSTLSYGYNYQILVERLDSQGQEVWSETYGWDGSEFGWALTPSSEGGYAIAGWTNNYSLYGEALLLRIDESGNEIWRRTYGGNEYDVALSVVEGMDGGYAFVGNTDSFGAGGSDVWMIRTDSSGNQLWDRTFGGGGLEYASTIRLTADGGYIISGSQTAPGEQDSDFLSIKVAGDGMVIYEDWIGTWEYEFDTDPGAGAEYSPFKVTCTRAAADAAIECDIPSELLELSMLESAQQGTGANIELIYSQTGTYDVRLTVTDQAGATDLVVQSIEVAGLEPVASFDVVPPDSGAVNWETCSLSYENGCGTNNFPRTTDYVLRDWSVDSSLSSNEDLEEWIWDFAWGQGDFEWGYPYSCSYTKSTDTFSEDCDEKPFYLEKFGYEDFPETGEIELIFSSSVLLDIRLRVRDINGRWDTIEEVYGEGGVAQEVDVEGGPPVANFDIDPPDGDLCIDIDPRGGMLEPEFCFDGIDNDGDGLTDQEEDICPSYEDTMLYYSFRNDPERGETYLAGGTDPGFGESFEIPEADYYAYDYSGWGNHSVLWDTYLKKWSPGKVGNSLYSGTRPVPSHFSKSFVEVPYQDVYNDEATTFETWLKPSKPSWDAARFENIFMQLGNERPIPYVDPPVNPVIFYKSNRHNRFCFAVQDADLNGSSICFDKRDFIEGDDDEYYDWNHVVGTYSGGENPELKIYLNGEEKFDSPVVPSFGSLGISAAQGDIILGQKAWVGAAQSEVGSYAGYYDETKIYNSALTLGEIRQNYCAALDEGDDIPEYCVGLFPDIVEGYALYLPFDESSGDVAPDESGNNNDGLLRNYYFLEHHSNDPENEGHHGSLEFRQPYRTRGNSDRMFNSVPWQPPEDCDLACRNSYFRNLNYWDDRALSIAAWVKASPEGSGTYQPIIHDTRISDHWGYHSIWFGLYIDTDDRFLFQVPIEGCSTGNTIDIKSADSYLDDEWHLVVATYEYIELGDEDEVEMSIYIDGQLEDSSTTSGVLAQCEGYYGADSGNLIQMGSDFYYWGDQHNFFGGSIDEVALYRSELTADQVEGLYDNYHQFGAGNGNGIGTMSTEFQFNDCSYAPDFEVDIGSWEWDMNGFVTTEQNPTRLGADFGGLGTYPISLTVSDDRHHTYQMSDTKEGQLEIRDIFAEITEAPEFLTPGETMNFRGKWYNSLASPEPSAGASLQWSLSRFDDPIDSFYCGGIAENNETDCHWSLPLDEDMEDGQYILTLTARDSDIPEINYHTDVLFFQIGQFEPVASLNIDPPLEEEPFTTFDCDEYSEVACNGQTHVEELVRARDLSVSPNGLQFSEWAWNMDTDGEAPWDLTCVFYADSGTMDCTELPSYLIDHYLADDALNLRFQREGLYYLKLNVRDQWGNWDSIDDGVMRTVRITNGTPIASFNIYPPGEEDELRDRDYCSESYQCPGSTLDENTIYSFINYSEDPDEDLFSCQWKIDGVDVPEATCLTPPDPRSFSYSPDPEHFVYLKVEDEFGQYSEVTQTITVTSDGSTFSSDPEITCLTNTAEECEEGDEPFRESFGVQESIYVAGRDNVIATSASLMWWLTDQEEELVSLPGSQYCGSGEMSLCAVSDDTPASFVLPGHSLAAGESYTIHLCTIPAGQGSPGPAMCEETDEREFQMLYKMPEIIETAN